MKKKWVSGACLCGLVRYRAVLPDGGVGACHCATCRTWHGGPQLGINGGTDVEFEGEESIRVFASSARAERGFCKECGSHLFLRLRESGRYVLMAGALEPTDGLAFEHQLFIDKKPSFYAFSGETRDLTEADFLARFA
jgi:hypothetical protein